MIRFKEAAEQIRKSGGPKKLTVRQLLALFGQQRRGRHVTAQIRRALKREKLETVPSFEVVHMDAPRLASGHRDESDHAVVHSRSHRNQLASRKGE